MASRPDVTTTEPATPGEDGLIAGTTVCCDQAVFTSIPTATGSGYRIVAASRGLGPEEKKQITTRSPSHDGLCDPGPEAVGVSFYPLDSGRFCVAYTRCAGLEGTARGGQRLYTRALVLDEAGFRRLGYNPFCVVRALLALDQAEPQLKPPPQLPALELPTGRRPETEALSRCAATVGVDWLGCVLQHALERRAVVAVGPFSSPALVEAIILALPGPLRGRLSFGAGLRFSLGRRFDLNALEGDARQLGHAVQGHGLLLIEAQLDRQAPPLPDCPWSQMARRRWQQNRWAELAELTGRDYPDCSTETLRRYGRLCNLRDDLLTFDAPALIDLLDDHLGPAPADDLEAELTVGLVRDALHHLTDRLSTAPIEELTCRWDDVVNLWCRSPSASALLGPLVGTMLKRMTRLSPLEAAAAAASALARALQPEADTGPVRQALHDLLDHLIEWVHDAKPEDIENLPHLLAKWPPAGSLAGRLQDLRDQINARPEPVTAASPDGPDALTAG